MKSRYITPVVTIFDEQGRIDPEQNTQVYDFIKNHVSGFVVMGSTGEFFSLNMENALPRGKHQPHAPAETAAALADDGRR